MDQPLNGICVVEISDSIAGSACTKTFSDYGARVIKVEPFSGNNLFTLDIVFIALVHDFG